MLQTASCRGTKRPPKRALESLGMWQNCVNMEASAVARLKDVCFNYSLIGIQTVGFLGVSKMTFLQEEDKPKTLQQELPCSCPGTVCLLSWTPVGRQPSPAMGPPRQEERMAVAIHTFWRPGCRDPSCEYEYSRKLYTQLNAKPDWLQLSLGFEHIFCFNVCLSKLICPSLVILPSGPHLTAFSLYSGYKPIDLSKSCARIKIEWGPQDSGWISWIAFRYDFWYKVLQYF